MFPFLMLISVLVSELGSAELPKHASTRIAQCQRARLREALNKKNVEDTRALIEEGVDLIAPFEDSETPLHIACSNKNKEALKWILDKGVPLEAKNNAGETAFQLSVMFGYMDIAAMLLEAGADINTTDKFSRTPLYDKVAENNIKRMEWLLRNGASLYPVDYIGRNAFDIALSWGWNNVKVRILIEYGADISPPKYDPMKIFEKYWESCFKIYPNRFNNFDNYVAYITEAFLKEQSEADEREDTLSIYAKNHVFALYRILKATYPEGKMRRIPSRLESAKIILYDILAVRITEKTYFEMTPLEMISDVLFVSERIFWIIERLSFYLALISVNNNYSDVGEAFTRDEITNFFEYFIR